MDTDFKAFLQEHSELHDLYSRLGEHATVPDVPVEFWVRVPRAEVVAFVCYLVTPLGTGALGCAVAGPLGGAIGLFGSLAFCVRLAMTDWSR